MAATERRQGGEFRVAGRTLSGTVLRYGDIAPGHRERFLPGAFGPEPRGSLNIQHDQSLVVLKAGQFVLADSATALEIRAELPSSSAALALVKRGALNGFSVEFNARRESRMGGVRVIERADLVGVGLVDQPAYPSSKAEVRRAEHRATLGTLGGEIPVGVNLDCKCSPGSCTTAVFEVDAFIKVPERERDILAVIGEYANTIGSRNRGGLRLSVAGNGSLRYRVDIPDNPRGRNLLDTLDTTPVYGRPVIDMDASDVNVAGDVATYEAAEVRAITFGPTDYALGWTAVELVTPDDDNDPAQGRRAARRRAWLL